MGTDPMPPAAERAGGRRPPAVTSLVLACSLFMVSSIQEPKAERRRTGFGWRVVPVGDADGDGWCDLAASAPFAPTADRTRSGVLLLLSGRDGTVLRRAEAGAGQKEFSIELDGGADLDSDGVRDVIVVMRVPEDRPGELLATRWGVEAFSGRTLLPVPEAPGQARGFSRRLPPGTGRVAGVQDCPVPGTCSVAVIQSLPSTPGIAGSDELSLRSLPSGEVRWKREWFPGAPRLVRAVPDLDGDRGGDLLVAHESNQGGAVPSEGSVTAVSGADGRPLYTVHGTARDGHLGAVLIAGGDVDGDDVPDFAASEPGAGLERVGEGPGPRMKVYRGRVALFSGKTGTLLWEVMGEKPGAGIGKSLAFVGDVDGDGVPDIAVGAPMFTPEGADVPRAGTVLLLSGRSGKVLRRIVGTLERGDFGAQVVFLPAAGGKSEPRLLVSAPGAAGSAPVPEPTLHVFTLDGVERFHVGQDAALAGPAGK